MNLFWRYKETYVTRNTPEKFPYFGETSPWFEAVYHPTVDNNAAFIWF